MVEITSEHTFKALKDRKAVDLALMQELVFCYVQGTQYACTRPETHKNINSLLFSCIPKENGQQPFKKKCGLGGGGARPLSAALNVYWEQAVWEFVSSLDNDAKLAKWPHLLKPPPHTHSLLLSGKRQASSQKPVQIKDRWQKSWAAVLKFENQMLRIKTEKVQIENIPIYLSEDLSEPFLIKFQQIYLHWE